MTLGTIRTAGRRPLAPKALTRLGDALVRVLPGVALCLAVTVVAAVAEAGEERFFGRAWLEALVMAILIGTAVRTVWTPGPRWRGGIDFSARVLLEGAIMLLGAAMSFRSLAAVGPALLFGIAAIVAVVIPTSVLICRALGLSRRMAILVACGNAICGNSAIAAVAPVIGAEADEVAGAIAFTAVLGVVVVLGLPLLVPLLVLGQAPYGVLAGLTVYAVPQVLAAAAPVGLVAVQIGTLVKLVRVLMLGPVILALSVLTGPIDEKADGATPGLGVRRIPDRVPLHRLVPWFVPAFLVLAALHTLDLVPTALLPPAASLAHLLTILSMAALGLGVDVRVVARAGLRVTAAATASLLTLGGISLVLIHGLGVT